MKHFNSIKKNKDFQAVYQTGKSYANKLLVMYVKKTDMPNQGLEYPSARRLETAL